MGLQGTASRVPPLKAELGVYQREGGGWWLARVTSMFGMGVG